MFCPVDLDDETGPFLHARSMEQGYFCRPLADYPTELEASPTPLAYLNCCHAIEDAIDSIEWLLTVASPSVGVRPRERQRWRSEQRAPGRVEDLPRRREGDEAQGPHAHVTPPLFFEPFLRTLSHFRFAATSGRMRCAQCRPSRTASQVPCPSCSGPQTIVCMCVCACRADAVHVRELLPPHGLESHRLRPLRPALAVHQGAAVAARVRLLPVHRCALSLSPSPFPFGVFK